MPENKETCEQYIKRMTGTEGKLFTPTGWISVQRHTYRRKTMLFVQCYTDCIYKAGQPVAKFWMKPIECVHLASQLLSISQIWNIKRLGESGGRTNKMVQQSCGTAK